MKLLQLCLLFIAASAFAAPKYYGTFYGDGGLTNAVLQDSVMPGTTTVSFMSLANYPTNASGQPVLFSGSTAIQNGSGLTNVLSTGVVGVTNANNGGVLPCFQTTYTNLSGNIAIGGFSGAVSGRDAWFTLMATNGSGGDLTVTMPTGCQAAQGGSTINAGALVFYATNGGWTQISGKLSDLVTNVGGAFFKAP